MNLAGQFDLLLLDLDGTVYLGGKVIPHAAEAIGAAASAGVRSMYVTNNASRSPADVAGSLQRMGIPAPTGGRSHLAGGGGQNACRSSSPRVKGLGGGG